MALYINYQQLNFSSGSNPKVVPVTNKHLLILNEGASVLSVKHGSNNEIISLAVNTSIELLDCIDGLTKLEFSLKAPASGTVHLYSFGKPDKLSSKLNSKLNEEN